jgi:omega-hydroxy-beta-dihydromenaquinone-9 sulfotransferase
MIIENAYLLAGMRLGMLTKLVRRLGISWRPKYLARLFFLLQGGLWSSLLAWRENRLNGKRISEAPNPPPPVFIVGHWRTGSTYLHQLLNCDPALNAPTIFQCSFPESFISARSFAVPIMFPFVRGHRPMDNVKVGLNEPHEDEYALFRLSGFSPLERFIFPRNERYFLLNDETFLPTNQSSLATWKTSLLRFVKKLHFASGQRAVLKNPFHSLRIPLLRELFPEALFIHIHRNPLNVIPSTVHMWSVFGRQNAMRSEWSPPSVADVISGFSYISTRLKDDLAGLPQERCASIAFEELEQDPIKIMKDVYSRLGLDFSEATATNITKFLHANANYKKNEYKLSEKENAEILDAFDHQSVQQD